MMRKHVEWLDTPYHASAPLQEGTRAATEDIEADGWTIAPIILTRQVPMPREWCHCGSFHERKRPRRRECLPRDRPLPPCEWVRECRTLNLESRWQGYPYCHPNPNPNLDSMTDKEPTCQGPRERGLSSNEIKERPRELKIWGGEIQAKSIGEAFPWLYPVGESSP